jgi:hypothetical protein
MDTTALRLPVQTVAVRLRYQAHDEVIGEVYLSRQSALREGPMTVRELLEGEARFFAFARPECPAELLNKDLIETIEYDSGLFPEELAEAELIPRTAGLLIELNSGRRIEGELCEDLPPERSRALDGLNQRGRFLRIRQQGSFVLINKARIARVLPPGS